MQKSQQLAGRKVAVFDAEIKKRIEDCTQGWQSHDEMGVSVLVIFDYQTMRYRVFDDRNAAEAMALLQSYELVVGYVRIERTLFEFVLDHQFVARRGQVITVPLELRHEGFVF